LYAVFQDLLYNHAPKIAGSKTLVVVRVNVFSLFILLQSQIRLKAEGSLAWYDYRPYQLLFI